VLLTSAEARAQDRVVVKDARIIPVNGPEIEKGSILIENGKITAVGPTVDTPYDAKVIDATGKVVFPGLVDAHSNRGMDRPNETYPLTPFLSVADSLDGASVEFEDSLRDGVTTIHVIHGNAQAIAGRSMIVKPVGRIVENMAIVYDGPLKMSFIPRNFTSRVAQFAELRRAFDELADYMERSKEKREDEEEREQQKAEEEKKSPEKKVDKKDDKPAVPKAAKEEEAIDRRRRTLVQLTKGKVPVFVACNAAEVSNAIEFAKKHGFFEKMTLVLGADAWKVVDAVAASGRPVVLDAELIHRERDPLTGKEVETPVAPVFAKKNVKFALQRTPSSYTQRYLPFQAALAIRSGLDREAALKSITLWPAEILGLGDRFGAIDKGRDGTLLILSGDPLSTTTFVDTVLIDGQVAYERAADDRLKRVLNVQESK
jgi:imidazolonepropionase-like amidohydrolase